MDNYTIKLLEKINLLNFEITLLSSLEEKQYLLNNQFYILIFFLKNIKSFTFFYNYYVSFIIIVFISIILQKN